MALTITIEGKGRNTVKRVTKGKEKKPKYLIFGDCKRCGFCCTYKKCEHFEWRNGEAVCKIFATMPQECKDYPEVPPVLTEECGYRFVDVKRRVKLEVREV